MDLRKVKPSKNFEDRSTPSAQALRNRIDSFLIRMGLAFDPDGATARGERPPIYKDELGDYYTEDPGDNEVTWTPTENKMMKKGMSPYDVFILRAYKKMPGLVGK